MTGRREEYVKRAEELLRGTRWEPELNEIKDEIRRGEPTLSSGSSDD